MSNKKQPEGTVYRVADYWWKNKPPKWEYPKGKGTAVVAIPPGPDGSERDANDIAAISYEYLADIILQAAGKVESAAVAEPLGNVVVSPPPDAPSVIPGLLLCRSGVLFAPGAERKSIVTTLLVPGAGDFVEYAAYDEDERALRAEMNRLIGQIRNSEFGSALTGYEITETQKWSPLAPGIGAEDAVTRLRIIAENAEKENENLRGGRSGGVSTPPPPARRQRQPEAEVIDFEDLP